MTLAIKEVTVGWLGLYLWYMLVDFHYQYIMLWDPCSLGPNEYREFFLGNASPRA
jgi:hypothetical protein